MMYVDNQESIPIENVIFSVEENDDIIEFGFIYSIFFNVGCGKCETIAMLYIDCITDSESDTIFR